MTTGRKIAVLFAIFGFAIAALAMVAITPINRDMAAVGEFHAPALHALQDIQSRLMVAVEESFAYALSGEEIEKMEFIEWVASFDKQIEAIGEMVEPGGSGVDREEMALERIRAKQGTLVSNARAMFDQYESTGEVSPQVFSAYEHSIDDIEADFGALLDIKRRDMARAQDRAVQSLERARFLFFTLAIFAVLASVGCGLGLSRYVDSNELKLIESQQRHQEMFDEGPGCFWVEDWSEIKLMVDRLAEGGVENWREYFSSNPDRVVEAYNLSVGQDVSRGNLELFGSASMEELLRESRGETVIASELNAFVEVLVGLVEGRYRGAVESVDSRADGSEVAVRTVYAMPKARRARWSRIIYLLEDVSERIEAEEKLRQAQKMEAVGQLCGGIAHDFNNLLTVIMGNLEMLREQKVGQESARELVDNALEAAGHGAMLTQGLLAFSRKQPLAPRYVDVNHVVDRLIGLLRHSIDETVTIRMSLSDEPAPVLVDTGQLETALINLAINARDALGRNGEISFATGSLRIEASDCDLIPGIKPGEYVTLSISDNGAGMPSDILERVFEPFFSTKDVGKGSGLGLSMVYGFVKQSHGHVSVSSEVGRGTTVKIYLPMASGVQAEQDVLSEKRPQSTRAKCKILVVEDEEMVRTLMVRVLTDMGHTVHDAIDGETALSIVAEEPNIDLLLTDVMLPGGVDGFELARRVRLMIPDLPVLFSSGYSATSLVSEGRIEDGVEVLLKPFKLDDLVDRINELLASAQC